MNELDKALADWKDARQGFAEAVHYLTSAANSLEQTIKSHYPSETEE